MKKIMALIGLGIVLSFFNDLSAQIYVGGRVSFNNNSNNNKYIDRQQDYKSTNASLYVNPNVGYFLADNILLGAGVSYSIYSNSWTNNYESGSDYESKNENSELNFEPFIRHYIPLTERIKLYNQAGIFFGFTNSSRTSFYSDEDYKDLTEGEGVHFGFLYQPGLCFNITDKLDLELGIGNFRFSKSMGNEQRKLKYLSSGEELDGDEIENNNTHMGFSINSFSIGLSFKI